MPGLIPVIGNDELQAQENEEIRARQQEQEEQQKRSLTSSLANHIRHKWHIALRAKDPVERKMMKALRQYRNQYEADKMAAIKQIQGATTFMPLTNMKCRAAEAWVKEILLQSGNIPWDLAPTPRPELPPDLEELMKERLAILAQQMLSQYMVMSIQAGQPIMPEIVETQLKDVSYKLRRLYEKAVMDKSKEAAEKMKDRIQDQFIEGGFYQALDQAIHDITIFPCAVIKGPILRIKKSISRTPVNEGEWTTSINEDVVECYERVSPLDLYVSPNSVSVEDGFLIEKISFSLKDLRELKDLGEEKGFDSEEIDKVLQEARGGSLKEWLALDSERTGVEDKTSEALLDQDTVDALEYWDVVEGQILRDWGMDEAEIPDPTRFYPICAWLIGNHVIKAMINPDPMGNKPYSKASLISSPDSFWGISLPEVLEDLQGAINAVVRAMINNAAIASGPLVERNIDRLGPGETKAIWPWKIFDSTESAMGTNAPAYRFYQPPMVVDKLLIILQDLMKSADELSGIPAYAHGDVTVGGAGRTATGLSMLTTNANRGIKAIIKNIDEGLIEPTVERQYYFNIQVLPVNEEIPDMKIEAKGSIALAEKELASSRRNEFLTATTNPADLQILGQEGRKFLLEEVAKAYGIDVDKLFRQDSRQILEMLASPMLMPPAPIPALAGTDLGVANQAGMPGMDPSMSMMGAMAGSNPAGFNAMTGGSQNKPVNQNEAGIKAGGGEVKNFEGRNG